MRIVVCEDDIDAGNLIKEYIINYYKMKSLGRPEIKMFSSAEKMLETKTRYDIAFLDVELPGLSGIAAGKRLRKWNNNIILFIVTGYADAYLDESFEVGVFRYLMKPLDEMRLHRNLQMAIKKYKSICHKIILNTNNGLVSVDSGMIVLARVENRKTVVYTTEAKYTVSIKIKELSEKLPQSAFMIVNKGVLVGFQHVKCENKGELIMTGMESVLDIVVSRKYLSEFRKRWLLFQEIR